MFYLVREDIRGHIDYVVEADNEAHAIQKCSKMQDSYAVDMEVQIESEEISNSEEIDLENLEDLDYNIQQAVKWLQQDAKEPEEEKPKRRRRKKTVKEKNNV